MKRIAVALLSLTPQVPAQTCLHWEGLGAGLDGTVWAATGFDDGNGEALYVGGNFTTAGGNAASNVARWDGTVWSPLGAGLNGQVQALCVFDEDGPGPLAPALFAAGDFDRSGGTAVDHVARWNGSAWSAVGGGIDNTVHALEVFAGELVAGGLFFTAGGNTALFIAAWDGAAWSPLGLGLNGTVDSLTVYDDGAGADLYAGGYFSQASGVPASLIARWDGANWTGVGGGLTGHPSFTSWVDDLAVHDDGSGPALYATGLLTGAGGLGVSNIARWNGASWSGVGGGLGGTAPAALCTYDDGSGPALYVGGASMTSGATTLKGVGRWDGIGWSTVGINNGVTGTVLALAAFDGGGPALVAGGLFAQAGGQPVSNVAAVAPAVPPVTYCTAKLNSAGCVPSIQWSGCPSASDPTPFLITADQVVNQRKGLLYYSASSQALPFFGGTLCVGPATKRYAAQKTGGSAKPANDCSGTLSADLNALVQSGANPALVPGARVFVQYVYRDPLGPTGAIGTTDAIDFLIHP